MTVVPREVHHAKKAPSPTLPTVLRSASRSSILSLRDRIPGPPRRSVRRVCATPAHVRRRHAPGPRGFGGIGHGCGGGPGRAAAAYPQPAGLPRGSEGGPRPTDKSRRLCKNAAQGKVACGA
ncbi:hypothetical protein CAUPRSCDRAFT_11402 [Caulochytrium protostelioides]|uniref:Uncharacterized protein n=1 Tax=Caulochytrium protostelioides TaxID=1555241 RepID=A0A4P9WUG3_9FUNG|nr:hypothetical protein CAUPRSCDRAFT_11402 [Caulochytrium protostelioides]